MKPKNRIFCFDCGKSKLLFETEKKALTYIKFNADEIEEEGGYRPIRAYFCQACGGWHVTHKAVDEKIKRSFTEKVLLNYNRDKKNEAYGKLTMGNKIGQFLYIGLFLSDESKEQLKKYIDKHCCHIITEKVKKQITKHYLEHCTILHKSQIVENISKSNRIVEKCLETSAETEYGLYVDAIGISDKAVAFRVKDVNFPIMNTTPHITIATLNDGKPVDSNNIVNWYKLPKNNKIKVNGFLKKV